MPRRFQNGKLLVRGKRPYWYVKVSVPVITADGPKKKPVEKIIGFCDEVKRKDAEKMRSQILEAVNSHKILAAAHMKFSELAERYRSTELPLVGIGAQLKNSSVIKVHLLPAFADVRLSEMDTCAIQQWVNTKIGEYSWWSCKGMLGVLSGMFTAAKRWNLFDGDNPVLGVRLPKKKLSREKRLITAGQLVQILGAVQDRERFIVTILYVLGLRISECLGLKWQDIDFEQGVLKVQRRWYRGDLDDTKSEAGTRELALGPLVDEFKQRYPGPQAGFIFADPTEPPDDRELLRWNFRPVLVRLGLYYEGFGWHAFRRANVTLRQTLGGATPVEAMKAAGHSRMDMTMLYSLADKTREAEQVEKLMGLLYQMPDGEATKQ